MAVKQLAVKVRGDIREWKSSLREMNSDVRDLKDNFRRNYGELRDGLGSMGRTLTAAVTVPIAGIGAAAINSALEMDSLRLGLESVTGGAEQARQEMKELREVAKLPGLGLKEAIQGDIGLQAAGMDAKMAKDALKEFGNALAQVGRGKEYLDGVTLALTQIISKGKVSAEEINQIAERVPQIRKIMIEAFGTADTETLQKRNIGPEEFISKVLEKMKEDIPRVAGGIRNEIENMRDKVDMALADLGKDALPVLADLLKEGNKAIDMWNRLPDSTQKSIIKVALFAAAVGPAALALNALVGAGQNVRSGLSITSNAFKIVTTWIKSKTAAAVVDTGVQNASLAADTRKVLTQIAVAKATQGTALATQLETSALVLNMNGVTAATALDLRLASAKVALAQATTLSGRAMAGASVAGLRLQSVLAGINPITATLAIAAIATAGELIYEERMRAKNFASREKDSSGFKREQASYTSHLKGASDDRLKKELAKREEERQAARDRMLDYENSSGWDKWQGANKDEYKEATYQYNTANQRVVWLKKQLSDRAAKVDDATKAAKELNDKQKALLRENEENNRQALREKYILTAANEFEKQKREAMVEYANAKDKILEAKRKAKDEQQIDLNVTSQLKTAELEYKAKMEEIVRAEEATNKSVAVQLAAIKNQDVWAREISGVQSSLTETLMELKNKKASQLEIAKATAEADEEIARINAQKEAHGLSQMMTGYEAAALRSENKYAADLAKLSGEYVREWSRLRELARQGYDVRGEWAMMEAKLFAGVKDISESQRKAAQSEEFAKSRLEALQTGGRYAVEQAQALEQYISAQEQLTELAQKGINTDEQASYLLADFLTKQADEKYNRDFGIWKDRVGAISEVGAMNMESVGDMRGAERVRFLAEMTVKQEELTHAKEQAYTVEEKALLAEKQAALELSKRKGLWDIVTGGTEAFYSKVKDYKDAEMEAWKQRVEFAKQYVDHLRDAAGLHSISSVYETAMASTLKNAMIAQTPMPYLGGMPSQSVTPDVIRAVFENMQRETQQQTTIMGDMIRTLEKLIPQY